MCLTTEAVSFYNNDPTPIEQFNFPEAPVESEEEERDEDARVSLIALRNLGNGQAILTVVRLVPVTGIVILG